MGKTILFREPVLSVPFTIPNRLFDLSVQFVQFVKSYGLLGHLAGNLRCLASPLAFKYEVRRQMEPFKTPERLRR